MIDKSQVAMRTGNVSFSFSSTGGGTVSLAYQVYSIQLGDVIHQGVESKRVPTLPGMEAAASLLYANAQARFEDYMARHESRSQIQGYSAHDADLILDSWWFPGDGDMSHPICGSFSGVEYDPTSYVSLVNAILNIVAPPPLWFWAESIAPDSLRVRCVGVQGASSCNVYDGAVLLGSVPPSGWRTLAVPAGVYSVRAAPVVNGQVGILSFPVGVTVGGAEPEMLHGIGTPVSQQVYQKRKMFIWWDKVKRWLVYGA